jgi:hypothetical protein
VKNIFVGNLDFSAAGSARPFRSAPFIAAIARLAGVPLVEYIGTAGQCWPFQNRLRQPNMERFKKRQKEMRRLDQQKDKAARRIQRKQNRAGTGQPATARLDVNIYTSSVGSTESEPSGPAFRVSSDDTSPVEPRETLWKSGTLDRQSADVGRYRE